MKKKIILAFGIAVVLLASCGPSVKVSVRGTKDGVTINTTQSASDSTALNITVNPNLNFNN